MATCVERTKRRTSGLNVDPSIFANPATIYNFVEYSRAFGCTHGEEKDDIWVKMKEEARRDVEQEPVLGSYYISAVLAHDSLESALATHLGYRLATTSLPGPSLSAVFLAVFLEDRSIGVQVREDW